MNNLKFMNSANYSEFIIYYTIYRDVTKSINVTKIYISLVAYS